jgi:hypothetical protein
MIALGIAAGLVAVAWAVLNVGPHLWTRRGAGGPPGRPRADGSASAGVAVFVESVRWLGVRWGLRTTARGLRQAGFRGRLLYWRWHATWRGWLVLPALMDASLLEREAVRLARFLERLKRRRPRRPVYLIGYSCGAYVAVRALEMMSEGACVDGAAALAGAFSPGRDLSAASRRVRRRLVVCSSPLDWCIIGLGTLVFRTADGQHTPSAGMVGTRRAGRRVLQIRWRPGMVRVGYWGGHFAASCAGFVRDHVAPALGVAAARGSS